MRVGLYRSRAFISRCYIFVVDFLGRNRSFLRGGMVKVLGRNLDRVVSEVVHREFLDRSKLFFVTDVEDNVGISCTRF